MKKFYKSAFCLAAVAGIFATPAKAEEVAVGDFVFDVSGSEATLVSWTPAEYFPMLKVEVPNTVSFNGKDYPVTAVADNAFFFGDVTSVKLGENVKTLGTQAFKYCQSLTDVTFNEGLVEIGEECFSNCKSLTELTLPNTLEVIDRFAFLSCTGLAGEIEIPASVKEIGDAPWRSISTITDFKVDPASTSFTAVDGVLFTKDINTLVEYPAGKADATYTVPATVTTIANQSMRNNPNLTSVVLPEGLVTIGAQAFASSKLTTIDLPSTVKTIGGGAFLNNLQITAYNVADGNPWLRSEGGMLIESPAEKVVCAVATIGTINIPDGIKEIGDYAFYMFDISKVVFPASVRSTGHASFANCNMLKTAELNEGLETIGAMSFQDCPKLTGVVFPTTLKKMCMQAFCDDASLTTAILPEGLEEMEETVFFSCEGLEEVYVPSTVKKFGYSIFGSCTALTKAVIAEGITEIPNTMFNWDWMLTDVTLPSTLEVLGEYCLYGAGFTQIDLPAGLKRIDEAALYGTGLTSIVLPDAVEELGPFALAWNFSMESIKTGKGLKKIAHHGIHNMPVLTQITLNEGLEVIEDHGISAAEALPSITIPSTVTTIGEEAFWLNPFDEVINLAKTPQVLDGPIFYRADADIYDVCVLSVPEESVEDYKDAYIWREFLDIKGDATGVSNISTEAPTVKDIYTLDGRRVENPGTGVYIFRMSDGTAQKRAVK